MFVIFAPFKKEDCSKSSISSSRKSNKNFEPKGITIALDEQARNFLVETGFEEGFGARPVRRTLEINLEDLLATYVLSHPNESKHFLFTAENNTLRVADEETQKQIDMDNGKEGKEGKEEKEGKEGREGKEPEKKELEKKEIEKRG